MSDINLNCADCDELFLEYFEGDLDARRRALVDAHVAGCARCQGIVRDFDVMRREAAALGDLSPSRDLWSEIEARIQPSVVSIGERREGLRLSRRAVGLAAAGLVIISSSVTWLATRGNVSDRGPVRVVEAPAPVPSSSAGSEVGVPVNPTAEEPASPVTQSGATTQQPVQRTNASPGKPISSSERPRAVERSPRTSLVKSTNVPPPTASELALAPEIAQLQKTIRQRRDQLDPETVRVVEDNLKLIDLAVQQAKAALRKDPASGFLNEQLDGALQKKIELLRTVALLPSRS